MQGNDISNGSPVRFLVAYNICMKSQTVLEKKRFRKAVEITSYDPDDLMLSALWRFQNRMNCTLDLVIFTEETKQDQKKCDDILEMLELKATNPFRSANVWRSPIELAKKLAYMPTVAGVIDAPERAFIYGTKFIDLSRVTAL